MEAQQQRQMRLICPSNHIFDPGPEIMAKLLGGLMKYTELRCPFCEIPIRDVICSKCEHCVPPYSPCQCWNVNPFNCTCHADPLISKGIC